jgi:UPF0716 protein FxsA
MPVLILLLIVVPLVELFLIIQMGQLVGLWPTLALLVLDSILGAVLLRHQGTRAWTRFRLALDTRRVPATETADGALVVLGGALLLTPGFFTDALGFLMLIPPTRAVIRRIALGKAMKMGASSLGGPAVWGLRGARWGTAGVRYQRGRSAARRDYDVDGTATDPGAAELGPRTAPGA